MSLIDRAKEAAQQQMARPAVQAAPGGCPGSHYVTEVNKGSINMGRWQSHLNEMHGRGYRLAQVFEQDGNTVQVFEHHFH